MAGKSSFRMLWIGQSLANCGDVFYIVGLMAIIYAITGSAAFMALVPFFNTLARSVGGVLAPLSLNRLGLKGTLVTSQSGKTFFLTGLALVSSAGIIRQSIWPVFAFVMLISFLDGWAAPARNALIPHLIPPKGLAKANSFLSILDQLVNMGSWACGGLLAARFGGAVMIWTTVLLFVLSTIGMACIRTPETKNDNRNKSGRWKELKEGWLEIWHTPVLRCIAIIDAVESAAFVVWIAAIIYVFVRQALHVDASWWGYINFSFFAGLILGGLIGFRRPQLIQRHLETAVLFSMILTGAATLGFGMNKVPWLALFLSMMVGMASQIKDISFATAIQTDTDRQKLGKVYAALDVILSVSFGLSTLLFGFLVDLLGVRPVFILSALLLFFNFLIFFSYIRKSGKKR